MRRNSPLSDAEKQNAAIYENLEAIAESDYFSKIKLGLGGNCPRAASKVLRSKLLDCRGSLGRKSGYIDLLKTREAYSPTGAVGSAEVWADLYGIARSSAQMSRLLSGLRFSIGHTHCGVPHQNTWPLFCEPRLVSEEVQRGIQGKLCGAVRGAQNRRLHRLPATPAEINGEVLELSRKIMEENGRVRETSRPAHGVRVPSPRPGISDQVNPDNIFIDPQHITTLTEMLEPLACLSCAKCLLWGTIQLRGLRAAVKAINSIPIDEARPYLPRQRI
ncbi:uncharacterized protein LOC124373640 [Homalodisca vitripennis]|uniref:uncharacterized protein LOC124373640 n=1 Tax=Homalodisca vitripennis TaxID=197043 RepID=UPI001EEA5BCA|nr:uncharacterized protein LOC124373640 [Homalodisca vitripennis]